MQKCELIRRFEKPRPVTGPRGRVHGQGIMDKVPRIEGIWGKN